MSVGDDVRSEAHPHHSGYRLIRRLRALRDVKGWRHAADRLAPPNVEGHFLVRNGDVWFEGDVGSFIDREVYLYGGYEMDRIERFLELVPKARRGVILDVGANVGTHTLRFASEFAQVYSFEPNPRVFRQLERNLAINRLANVTPLQVGLGREASVSPLFSIEKSNLGLATFLKTEQYDLPLKQIGEARIEVGDDFLRSRRIDRIDALKIDVQGYELEVLAGLRGTLEASRPVVWFEFGAGTESETNSVSVLAGYFPYPVQVFHVTQVSSFGTRHTACRKVEEGESSIYGDFVAVPSTSR